jgi:hypothetical protein
MDPNRIVDMASAFYESCVLFAAANAAPHGLGDHLTESLHRLDNYRPLTRHILFKMNALRGGQRCPDRN